MFAQDAAVVGAAGGISAVGRRRPDIQGLRAVAVLVVVAFHAGLPVPGGFIGVDVFFVISGFVITAMLHREWSATGRLSFGQFYWRRFKRLTPALALMITVVLVASILILSPFGSQQTVAETAVGAMLLVANFVIARTAGGYFDAPAETNPLLNTWSLSVEEQFYFLFPVIIAIGWSQARRGRVWRSSPYVLITGVAILSFGFACAGAADLTFKGSGVLLGFYSPFSRAWEFAAGALLALALTRRTLSWPGISTAAGIVGLLLLAVGLWAVTDTTPFPGPWTLIPVAATLLLIFSGTDPRSPTSRLLQTRPMVKVGDWSYSIYLWHWPIIVFATIIWPGSEVAVLAAASLSFAPALLSHRWVEQPIRALPLPSRSSAIGLVAATLFVPLALAALLGLGARATWWMAWPTATRQSDHVALANCTDKPVDPSLCTWNSDAVGGNVLVVGDSQAYAIADGVIAAATPLELSVTVSSRSGCPFVESDYLYPSNELCEAWQGQLLDYALSAKPTAVVIANRSSGYINQQWGWGSLATTPGGSQVSTNDEASQSWTKALASITKTLRDEGIAVIVVNSIPDVNNRADSGEGASIARDQLYWYRPLPIQASREQAEAARQLAIQAERTVASVVPGVVLFDPIPILCDEVSCPKTKDGKSLYLDWGHLSREGALRLAPALAKAINRAVQQD